MNMQKTFGQDHLHFTMCIKHESNMLSMNSTVNCAEQIA